MGKGVWKRGKGGGIWNSGNQETEGRTAKGFRSLKSLLGSRVLASTAEAVAEGFGPTGKKEKMETEARPPVGPTGRSAKKTGALAGAGWN